MKVCGLQEEIEISEGWVRGRLLKTLEDQEFLSVEGIPYAEPPVGPLRWMPPTRLLLLLHCCCLYFDYIFLVSFVIVAVFIAVVVPHQCMDIGYPNQAEHLGGCSGLHNTWQCLPTGKDAKYPLYSTSFWKPNRMLEINQAISRLNMRTTLATTPATWLVLRTASTSMSTPPNQRWGLVVQRNSSWLCKLS